MMYSREDWTAFRTLDGLIRRAGAPMEKLASVVVKELVDNALDNAGDCKLQLRDGIVTVSDLGDGIEGDEDDEIGYLFSIKRPMASTKYLRLPTRGALGNGLRVVAGAVARTDGTLRVSTRGRTMQIIPDPDSGLWDTVRVGDFDGPGTRIELELGEPLELMPEDLMMAEIAITAARAQKEGYKGRSSPHWYDPEAFHELFRAAPYETSVRDLIAKFEGCSAKADAIAGALAKQHACGISREEAQGLLERAKAATKPVNPDRLGSVGEDAFPGAYYKKGRKCTLGPHGSSIQLPVVVEVWADRWECGSDAVFMVNGTPCVADVGAVYKSRDKTTIVYGPGLMLDMKTGKSGMLIHVNIITPYIPYTSDGKSPDLGAFEDFLREVIVRAVQRAVKAEHPSELKTSAKAVVFDNMEEQIGIVSDNRRLRFNWRQVFYRVRPDSREGYWRAAYVGKL